MSGSSAGAGQRLTAVVGSAGAGKSVLLADWAAARPPGMTFWLSCDRADADPARFWAGFIRSATGYRTGIWCRCHRPARDGQADVG